MTNPVGRPSEYEPKFILEVYSYIAGYEERKEIVPTIEGFARSIGTTKQTLNAWEKNHPEFLDATDAIRNEQAFQLMNKGLGNLTNPAITKLMLSANHGMAEKNETDVTSKGEKITGIAVEFVTKNEA